MTEEEPTFSFELTAPDYGTLQQMGQFVSFLLMVEEILDGIMEWRKDDEDGEPTKTPQYLLQGEFYGFFSGCMAVHSDYRDAILPLAMFGREMTISAFMASTRLSMSAEEEIAWPEDLTLPAALLEPGNAVLKAPHKRDHAKDMAVAQSLYRGNNVNPPHMERTQALIELLIAVMEVIDTDAYADLTLIMGAAYWNLGDTVAGLEMLRVMDEMEMDGGELSKRLADQYHSSQPEGPVWLRIQADREMSA